MHCTAGHVECVRQGLPQRHPGSAGQTSSWMTAQSVCSKHAQTERRLPESGKHPHRESAPGPRRPARLPESPFLFILVTEMALASLHDTWAKRGLGYLNDGLWLPDVSFADDVVLLATSTTTLQTMLLEVEEAFSAVGLTLNLGKTNFTSTLACEGKTLELSGHVVKWSPTLCRR